MFSTWSLKAKLIGAFSFCAIVLGFVGGLSYFRLTEVVDKYSHVVNQNMSKLAAITDMVDSTRRMNIFVERIHSENLNPEQLRKEEEYINAALKDAAEARKKFMEIPLVDGEEALFQTMDEHLKKVMDLSGRVLEGSRTNDPEALKKRDALAETFEEFRRPYREAMDRLRAFQQKESDKWSNAAAQAASNASSIILSLVSAGVIVSFLLGLFISNSITRTMLRVSDQLSAGADEVTSAASEISSTSEQLSSSATEQASSLQETASSIEEMSSMIKQNSDNANRSSETARAGQESADKGKQVIVEMLEAMNSIDSANKEISEVVKVIGQIGNKTKVIDDIVFKTQLLSFNASVEAARAGEHGKGFAVVAEEVGNLAQMSGNAAREISDMLEQSLERVERMISTSKQKVEVGIQVGKRCGDVLDELVGSVGEVNTMAGEIANACQEQSRGINEITRAMSQLDQVTQQNASASQQSASAAEELSQQAETLRASVMELLHLINGTGAQRVVYQQPHATVQRSQAAAQRKKAVPISHKKVKKLAGSGEAPSNQHEGFDEAA